MEKNYKVYAILDKDFIPKYIGLTSKNLQLRLKQHLSDFRCNSIKSEWIKANKNNISIITIVDKISDLDFAKKQEMYFISLCKKYGLNLLNGTEGGDSSPAKGIKSKLKGIFKVSKKIILDIRNDYNTGNYSHIKLSKKYNISKSSIDRYLKYNLKLKEIDNV